MDYKLVESCKYSLGEKHYTWFLHTGLYQLRDNYYYVIFDNENADHVIISSIVTSQTINNIESSIIEAIRKPEKLETIDDFYKELQKGFYGTMFKLQEGITE